VPLIRYGPPYDGFPVLGEYCPTLAPGLPPDGVHAPQIQKSRWYTFEYHVKLSTSAIANDGLLELWVDGLRAYSRSGNNCRGGCPDMGYIMILGWMNSADPQAGYAEYDNVVMSRAYIGPPSAASGLRGDLNSDNQVTLTDLRLLIQMLIGQLPPDLAKADLDGNGQLTLADVRALINILVAP
jgi:hypothetical protein